VLEFLPLTKPPYWVPNNKRCVSACMAIAVTERFTTRRLIIEMLLNLDKIAYQHKVFPNALFFFLSRNFSDPGVSSMPEKI